MSKKVGYFAYGSNMNTERLQNRVSSTKPLGRAKLPNKSLVCNKKGKDGSGKANLTDAAEDTVWGVLYEIDSAELDQLDRYENGYVRISLDVMNDQDSLVKAYVYVSSKLTDDARPYDWYKELMIKGAREHQLPAFYIARLEQIESKPDQRC
jgi:gamma-glutamylcyclotransferase (GGCT)/AIG2-like uncharacterized protein YtfP